MVLSLLVACGPDPEVARLSAEVAALRARIEALEAGPATAGAAGDPAAAEGAPEAEFVPQVVPLALLDRPDLVRGMGRFLQHRGPDGAYDGVRLSALRRGSFPDRVGLKNGDVVHAVNGRPVTTFDEALAARDTVKAERPSELRVRLSRRGEALELAIPVLPVGDPAAAPILAALEAEAEARAVPSAP